MPIWLKIAILLALAAGWTGAIAAPDQPLLLKDRFCVYATDRTVTAEQRLAAPPLEECASAPASGLGQRVWFDLSNVDFAQQWRGGWFLMIDRTLMDRMELTLRYADGTVQQFQASGDARENPWTIGGYLAFPVRGEVAVTRILVSFDDLVAVRLMRQIQARNIETFRAGQRRDLWLYGLFSGVLATMLLYNITLLATVKQ